MSPATSPRLSHDGSTGYEHEIIHQHPLVTSMPPSSMAPYDDASLFGPTLPVPVHLGELPLSSYEVDFQPSFYPSEICGQNDQLPPFPPGVSYYTPVSEASDFSDTMTPVSLHTHDFHGSPIPQSIELSPGHHRSMSMIPRSVTPETHRVHHHMHHQHAKDGLGIDASPMPHQLQRDVSIASTIESMSQNSSRRYAPIAPSPIPRSLKRSMTEDDDQQQQQQQQQMMMPSKKRKSESPSLPVEISDEDAFLLRLKDEESLSWKDIAARFSNDLGKNVQIPALQMRLKRLRERMRVWTDLDIQALRMAHDYWVSSKFEIIATKMADFGALEKWNAKQCSKKWQEIGFTHDATPFSQFTRTPTFAHSYTSSPIDSQTHPAFYPFVQAN